MHTKFQTIRVVLIKCVTKNIWLLFFFFSFKPGRPVGRLTFQFQYKINSYSLKIFYWTKCCWKFMRVPVRDFLTIRKKCIQYAYMDLYLLNINLYYCCLAPRIYKSIKFYFCQLRIYVTHIFIIPYSWCAAPYGFENYVNVIMRKMQSNAI